jgi:hypothetical protein
LFYCKEEAERENKRHSCQRLLVVGIRKEKPVRNRACKGSNRVGDQETK